MCHVCGQECLAPLTHTLSNVELHAGDTSRFVFGFAEMHLLLQAMCQVLVNAGVAGDLVIPCLRTFELYTCLLLKLHAMMVVLLAVVKPSVIHFSIMAMSGCWARSLSERC